MKLFTEIAVIVLLLIAGVAIGRTIASSLSDCRCEACEVCCGDQCSNCTKTCCLK